jgi:hypothetical protein
MAGDDAILHRVIQPGERLLWSGESSLRPFTKLDPILVPLSLVAFVVTAAAFVTSLGSGPLRIVLVGQLLALMFHASIGRLWLRFDRRRRTVYALTDRRAIEAIDGTTLTWRSVDLTTNPPVVLTQHGDLATVRFGDAPTAARVLRSSGLVPAACSAVEFVDVVDGAGVARMGELIVARHMREPHAA